MNPKEHPEAFVATLALIGAGIGIGKLLASEEKLTTRLVIGRALVTAGIGAAAGAVSLLFPSADPLVLYGSAAGLASLGTSGLEMIVHRLAGKSPQ